MVLVVWTWMQAEIILIKVAFVGRCICGPIILVADVSN